MRTLICPPFADFRYESSGSKSGGMYLLSTFLSPMTRDSRKTHDDDEATSRTRALATERRVSRRERETASRASPTDRPTASPTPTTTTTR